MAKKSQQDNGRVGETRAAVAGWMGGAQAGAGQWSGQRLGLPEHGPGSLAPLGRRVVALCVDWALALAISTGFFHGDPMITLGVFALAQVILVGWLGYGIGHRLLGMQVVRLGPMPRVGLPRAALRTVLICLVVPAVVWDADGRSLHDRAAGTVLVRR